MEIFATKMKIFLQETSFRNLGSAEKNVRPPKLGARSPPLQSLVSKQSFPSNKPFPKRARVCVILTLTPELWKRRTGLRFYRTYTMFYGPETSLKLWF